ncbi:hypothetical protein [Sulfitobacter sp. S190]|uniref:hypothetical protein n=1 Tax=Sulfitobacter sp. S190 TaxID=2867022 RepID=UPI0021A4CEA5|nr:hypothetical protein [Sulfitobacter sp. S190]UWR23523.1 hypothetical protein K3756_05975 [Sulfitobacter sp. S190]
MRIVIALCLCAALPACTQFPALDQTVTPALENADYATLVPLDPVLAQARTPGRAPEAINARLDGRIAALNARAARLRGGVLTGRERQRLSQGLR